jgi:hypothetical protein
MFGFVRRRRWYQSRVFLFADEANLERFCQDPDAYMAYVLRVEQNWHR